MQKEVIVHSAEELNKAIKSSNCSVIKLGADIRCEISDKIEFDNISNKILDGNGYKILGSIVFTGNNKNIEITNCSILENIEFSCNSNNTKILIKNCVIKKGINLYSDKITDLKTINTTLENKKQIIVLENTDNKIIKNKDIGQLIILNCSNIDILELTLYQTLCISGNNKNITISNCNICEPWEGICLFGTNDKIFIKNCKINGHEYGIIFYQGTSKNIEMIDSIVESKYYSIYFRGKVENMMVKNTKISTGLYLNENIKRLKTVNTRLKNNKKIVVLENEKNVIIESDKDIGELIMINCSNIEICGLNLNQTLYILGNNKNITIYDCSIKSYFNDENMIMLDYGIKIIGVNRNIEITNCYIENYGDDEIAISVNGKNLNIVIENNTFYEGSCGVCLTGNNKNIVIKNNTFVNNWEHITNYGEVTNMIISKNKFKETNFNINGEKNIKNLFCENNETI